MADRDPDARPEARARAHTYGKAVKPDTRSRKGKPQYTVCADSTHAYTVCLARLVRVGCRAHNSPSKQLKSAREQFNVFENELLDVVEMGAKLLAIGQAASDRRERCLLLAAPGAFSLPHVSSGDVLEKKLLDGVKMEAQLLAVG